jgi:DNA-binding NarL/FixJ family response regulator
VAEGKSSKEIGEMLCMSVRTVEKHRLQIMKRLGLKNMAALIKYAIKEGFSTLDF